MGNYLHTDSCAVWLWWAYLGPKTEVACVHPKCNSWQSANVKVNCCGQSHLRCSCMGYCRRPYSLRSRGWRWSRRSGHRPSWVGNKLCRLWYTVSCRRFCRLPSPCRKLHPDWVASSRLLCCCHTPGRPTRSLGHRGLMKNKTKEFNVSDGRTNKIQPFDITHEVFWKSLIITVCMELIIYNVSCQCLAVKFTVHKGLACRSSSYLSVSVLPPAHCCCNGQPQLSPSHRMCDHRAVVEGSSLFGLCCRRLCWFQIGQRRRNSFCLESHPRSGRQCWWHRSMWTPHVQGYKALGGERVKVS